MFIFENFLLRLANLGSLLAITFASSINITSGEPFKEYCLPAESFFIT